MRNKFLISIILVVLTFLFLSVSAFADETTAAISESTSLTQTDVSQSEALHQSDVTQSDNILREELEHINKHLDFYTTVFALLLVVLVIVALWLLFGRWFFRY